MKNSICVLLSFIMCLLLLNPVPVNADSFVNVEVNRDVTDNLNNNYEQDKFAFTLPNPGSVLISLNHSTSGDYTAIIYKIEADGTVIEQQSSNFISSTTTVNGMITEKGYKIRLAAGNYYILIKKIEYGDFSSESYTLKIEYSPESADLYEIQPNDTLEMAQTIKANNEYTGNLDGLYDNDYFKLDIKEKGLMQFVFNHSTDGDYAMGLYSVDSDGVLREEMDCSFISSNTTTTGYITEKSNYTRMPAGTYY